MWLLRYHTFGEWWHHVLYWAHDPTFMEGRVSFLSEWYNPLQRNRTPAGLTFLKMFLTNNLGCWLGGRYLFDGCNKIPMKSTRTPAGSGILHKPKFCSFNFHKIIPTTVQKCSIHCMLQNTYPTKSKIMIQKEKSILWKFDTFKASEKFIVYNLILWLYCSSTMVKKFYLAILKDYDTNP